MLSNLYKVGIHIACAVQVIFLAMQYYLNMPRNCQEVTPLSYMRLKTTYCLRNKDDTPYLPPISEMAVTVNPQGLGFRVKTAVTSN